LRRDARFNIINGSRIINNSYGLNLTQSGALRPIGNLIANNIFNNTVDVISDNAANTNVWNIALVPGANIIGGSQLGGNFWANPSGTGFSETCADLPAPGDGICDSPPAPYNIVYAELDHFPLSP
jgi:nitrous oxidase accessory protein